MNKAKKRDAQWWCRAMVHGFVICTVLAFVCFEIYPSTIDQMLFLPGGYSMFVAAVLSMFQDAAVLAQVSNIWLVVFSGGMLVGYVTALVKKRYQPFGIVIWADVAFQAVYGVYALASGNPAGFLAVLPDLVFSVGYGIVFWKML